MEVDLSGRESVSECETTNCVYHKARSSLLWDLEGASNVKWPECRWCQPLHSWNTWIIEAAAGSVHQHQVEVECKVKAISFLICSVSHWLSLSLSLAAHTFILNLFPSIVSLQPWNSVNEGLKSREKSLAWIQADAVIGKTIQRLRELRKKKGE